VDTANSSGAGMIDYLFAHPEIQIVLIDNKINQKRDQTTLQSKEHSPLENRYQGIYGFK
jgi:capsular polysaccharide biosynthesis protein